MQVGGDRDGDRCGADEHEVDESLREDQHVANVGPVTLHQISPPFGLQPYDLTRS